MADFSWLTVLGFLFLTFNSGMAIYRSNGDAGSVTFVVVSYLDLLALFACLRYYEQLDRHSPKRATVKAGVWSLTTLLTVMFSYKVAEIMPLPVKILVWSMAAATSCGGFYAFFVHDEKPVLPAAAPPAAAVKEADSN
ncbi:hypothetical protein BDA96_10G231000 [Sorghum bicolor]|uniref:Uncharacterized protein n=2 Tax=Sorghum bicolor TaxID=4558 RepID=C5Z552_SORBI|nr:uncharacterized protein LOC8079315 [Sorghum bicolor]EER88566.1 hypothetical protein SORBI_3010G175500 [Sorghum bicolor]KAG0514874.1 hypothetical protein BDA96_10G231000 [Sorghum bicolor]|eukprot:XP_021305165.1 uncharacterized protein LOC8079315 [Sorghum bicolor]